jgi:glycosyltransferase involved in cell wall biosynthesis
MSQPRIHCLLSPKEEFSELGAGAQSLKIIQTSRHSRFREAITVFGKATSAPYPEVAFQPLVPFWPVVFGDKMSLTQAYARAVRASPPDLIECFNRPTVALWLAKKFPSVPVTVYFGNDPQDKEGSRTVEDRKKLVERLAGVFSISTFVQERFLEGLDRNKGNVKIVRTGIEREVTSPPVKEKSIVFVGRMNPIKGALELAEALARVLPRHPDWSASLIGARWFTGNEELTPYELKVRRAAESCSRITVTGFMKNSEVRERLRRAAIAVVPSNWDEPFGRTGLEALAEGCAVIASRRGGLAELGHRVRALEAVTADEIERALEELIVKDGERERLQAVAWNDFPFTIDAFTREWDDARAEILSGASRR